MATQTTQQTMRSMVYQPFVLKCPTGIFILRGTISSEFEHSKFQTPREANAALYKSCVDLEAEFPDLSGRLLSRAEFYPVA